MNPADSSSLVDVEQDQDVLFDSIKSALEDYGAGQFVIVMDNVSRENEGDLNIAGEHMTTEKMAFMVRYCSGYVCVATTRQRLKELEIPLLVPDNKDPMIAAYGMSLDYKQGTTTGISAYDRAKTARALADPSIVNPDDFSRPGHMVPLEAAEGGVLGGRTGHTEAAVDLCRLSNCQPTGVISVMVNDDGSVKRRDDCLKFAREHGLKVITIDKLIEYRKNMNQ